MEVAIVHHDACEMAGLSSGKSATPDVPPILPAGNESKRNTADDPQAMVIASLRSQISDLFSQVSQLNNKLVQSYDRVSDLEDNIHITASNLRQSTLKVSQLELERTQHLAALNTGLLVEKDHVTSELTRLMEKATEEAARRGQAESARADIEKDLDDLSASLFDQANTMVAEARLQRAISERKVEEAERALKGAEDAVSSMQMQMQQLRDEKEQSEADIIQLRTTMGRGKWVEQPASSSILPTRLLTLHAPYQEFLLFIGHLRSIRPVSQHPPAISTLLPLPFLARLLVEDSDPAVRLDFAPSLNWLSRRSVLSAIYSGQLTIEPMLPTALLLESSSTSLASPMIPGSHTNISCALCGTSIFPSSSHDLQAPPVHPLRNSLSQQNWSTSLFKNPLTSSANPSPPLTPPLALPGSQHVPQYLQQVHVFRLAQSAPPSIPPQNQQRPTNYPLCSSGWCLARLRTTCSLWAFVRAGIIDRVWEEEVTVIHAPVAQKSQAPPLPPRRRSKITGMSMGSLWGMASGALGKDKSSPVKAEPFPEKGLPSVPAAPSHPDLLPAVNIKTPAMLTTHLPPPLPRRSNEREARSRRTSPVDEVKPAENQEAFPSVPFAPTDASSAQPAVADAKDPVPPAAIPSTGNDGPSQSMTIPKPGDAVHEFSTTLAGDFEALPTATAARPVSPAAIALPESRPGTPVPSASRRTSQVPMVHIMTEAKVPSRSGSPAPPPLPRRAARRPAPGPPGSQAQGSPQSPAVSLPSESPADMRQPLVPPVNPVGDQPLMRHSVIAIGETVPLQPDQAFVAFNPTNEPKRSSLITVEQVEELPPPVEADRQPAPVVADASAPPGAAAKPSEQAAKTDQTEFKADSPVEDDLTHGPLCGDGTWEERTWKEVVRLKEDMFWARIGALRF